VAEIGDAHHFCAGELPRGYKSFAQFAVENRHRAVNGGVNRRLRQLIARLARAGFGALDFVQRTFVRVLCHVLGCFCGIVFLFRNQFLLEQVFSPLEVVFRLHHGGFLLKIRGFCCADRCLLLLEKGLVGVRFNFH
jgi:hypothetical protein